MARRVVPLIIALALAGTACAAEARLGSLGRNDAVVTREEDPVALPVASAAAASAAEAADAAELAKETADAAKTAADAAKATADSAKTTADAAKNTADAAKVTADAAKASATEAVAAAANAESVAAGAVKTANAAAPAATVSALTDRVVALEERPVTDTTLAARVDAVEASVATVSADVATVSDVAEAASADVQTALATANRADATAAAAHAAADATAQTAQTALERADAAKASATEAVASAANAESVAAGAVRTANAAAPASTVSALADRVTALESAAPPKDLITSAELAVEISARISGDADLSARIDSLGSVKADKTAVNTLTSRVDDLASDVSETQVAVKNAATAAADAKTAAAAAHSAANAAADTAAGAATAAASAHSAANAAADTAAAAESAATEALGLRDVAETANRNAEAALTVATETQETVGQLSGLLPAAATGWVSPLDWTLTVSSGEEIVSVDETTTVSTNELGEVRGYTTQRVTTAAPKVVGVTVLDRTVSASDLPPASDQVWSCEGATVTVSDNVATVSAETEGVYRVVASSATDGRTRDAWVQLRAKTSVAQINAYLEDTDAVRKTANDAVLAALLVRDTSETVASGVTAAVAVDDKYLNGSTLRTDAPLPARFFAMMDPKNLWGPEPVVVAPNFAVTAAHWNPPQQKAFALHAPDGSGELGRFRTTSGVALSSWAKTNGYSDDEIRLANISDLWVWKFESTDSPAVTVPDEIIPWVIDPAGVDYYYGGSLAGIACYSPTQNGFLSYAVLGNAYGSWWTAFGRTPGAAAGRADIVAALSPPLCAQVYGGDSGRPILMIHDGQPVILSVFWSTGSGASLVTGADILDDFISKNSNGAQTLKRITAPEE